MTKTDSYFVNLGHAIIDYLLKLVGGKALRDKIGLVTYTVHKLWPKIYNACLDIYRHRAST
jgi:hypothetical protein